MLYYDSICSALIDRFPEVFDLYENEYESELRWPHVIYENYFVRYIKRVLRSGSEQTAGIFEFLEDMATSADQEVRNLLQVSVLEALADRDDTRKLMQPLMGPETRKIYEKLHNYMYLD